MWSVSNYKTGEPTTSKTINELGECNSDTMIKKWTLGLTKLQKIAHEEKIVKYKDMTFEPIDVGLQYIFCLNSRTQLKGQFRHR